MSTEHNPHTAELKEIFEQLPTAFPGKEPEVKMINFSILETIVGNMMKKAFYHGEMKAYQNMESMVETTFNP